MTSHQDQIQALIAEIDEVLSQPSPRLPWVAFGETVTRARQVLERVRNYLVSLQQEMGDSPRSLHSPASPGDSSSIAPPQQQDVWEAIREEMGYLRSQLTGLLQNEVEELRRERQRLVQDIRMLEGRREDRLTPIDGQTDRQQLIAEFLQELMNRLQESLTQRVAETLSHLEERVLNAVLVAETVDAPTRSDLERSDHRTSPLSETENFGDESETSKLLPRLTPAGRLEQMRMLQAQSDHLLMTLDSSLSVIFEALQSNLQTYHESLSQNLEKMHGLGKQGEVIFSAWINHLTQQLSQATTTQWQSSLQLTDREPTSPPPPKSDAVPDEEAVVAPADELQNPPQADREDVPVPEVMPEETRDEEEKEDIESLFPFAGVELPLPTQPSETQQKAESSPEDVIPPDGDATDDEDFASWSEDTDGEIGEETWDVEELFPAEAIEVGDNIGDSESEEEFAWDAEDLLPDEAVEEGEDITAETAVEVDGELPESEEEFAWDAEDLLPDEAVEEGEDITAETAVEVDRELPEEEEAIAWDAEDLFPDSSETNSEIESSEIEDDEERLDTQDLFGETEEEAIAIEPPENLPESSNGSRPPKLDESPAKRASNAERLLENDDLFEEAMNQPNPTEDRARQASPASQTPNFLDENTLEDFGNFFEPLELDEEQESPENLDDAKQLQDNFVHASPDENLLPSASKEDEDQIDSQLLIDKQTLQQLEAELTSLEQPFSDEGGEEFEVSSGSEELILPQNENAEETITFDNLFGELESDRQSRDRTQSPQPESAEDPFSGWDRSDFTLDDLLSSFDASETPSQPPEKDPEDETEAGDDDDGDFLSLEALYEEMNQANPLNHSGRKKS
ncbi:MAG: hypothetical protein ACP5D7_01800 [Limnospira sp.]